MSSRARAKAAEWQRVTRAAIAAAGGRCQFQIHGVCTGTATEGHHVLPRSQGGANTRANCRVGCHACHAYVTQHPAEAYAKWWLVKRGGGGK